jgi:ubiquitin-conjugating enzyme E2 I
LAAKRKKPFGTHSPPHTTAAEQTIDHMNAALSSMRKSWRANHPHGFVAQPCTVNDALDLAHWDVYIPGLAGTEWEGGLYKARVDFPADFPLRPPTCTFTPPLPHPNIFESGRVCMHLLSSEENWSPEVGLGDILQALQHLLHYPNPSSPAQLAALMLYTQDREAYEERARALARLFPNAAHVDAAPAGTELKG